MSDDSLLEPPYLTALRGISADVAAAGNSFDQRLSHFLRLPLVFDRLTAASVEDRRRAIDFLRHEGDDDEEASSPRLLTGFLHFVVENEMRNVDPRQLESFVRFSVTFIEDAASRFEVTDRPLAMILNAGWRLLYLLQTEGSDEEEERGCDHAPHELFEKSMKTVDSLVKRHSEEVSAGGTQCVFFCISLALLFAIPIRYYHARPFFISSSALSSRVVERGIFSSYDIRHPRRVRSHGFSLYSLHRSWILSGNWGERLMIAGGRV